MKVLNTSRSQNTFQSHSIWVFRPAPGLDPRVRAALCTDALKLVAASGYTNVGTVEYLVVPETGQHFFIECNPRIQVSRMACLVHTPARTPD